MTVTEFKQIAMDSAEKYYDFLEQSGRGIIQIEIRKISQTGDKFNLTLKSRISEACDLDSLLYAFNGRWHTSHEISPLKYDKDSKVLTVRPQKEFLSSFSQLSCKDLLIISDLKFLIKRVHGWYNANGSRIHVPEISPCPPQIVLPEGIKVSQQQTEAIEGALSSPFSYIWGAPGTGKTRVVLSSCVVSLVLSGQRVLLLAPTNNALEQMLVAIIPLCEQAGISRNEILRIGAPSSEFFQKYPTVCEVCEVEQRIQATSAKIDHLKKGLNYLAFCEQMELAESHISSLLDEMSELSSNYHESHQLLNNSKLSSAPDRAEDILLRQKINTLLEDIARHQHNVEHTGVLKRMLRHKWYTQEKTSLEEKMSILKADRTRLQEVAVSISVADENENSFCNRITELETLFAEKHKELLDVTGFWAVLKSSAEPFTIDTTSSNVEAMVIELEQCRKVLHEKSAVYKDLENKTKDELMHLLEKETKRLEWLQAGSTGERIKDISILACTVDKYLVQDFLASSFSPNHVFLDEAGYISLIKGLTTLSLDVPVTFLGDHMQLPPICEMDDREFKKEGNRGISLWAQSALYSECVFTHDIAQLCDNYLHGTSAPFQKMKLFSLDCTYRFGGELSTILADMVYTPAFHSAILEGTELLVLNAPHQRKLSGRFSNEEVTAILGFVEKNHPSNYAILTPYRAQRTQLLKYFEDEDILTVHASQGREWDTVFLSVVDTTQKWFTNSKCQESRGKAVINTAVSRAKKRLIIVCDYDFWHDLDDQLIGRLVQSARKIEV